MKDVNKFVEERKKCSNTVRHILISKRKKLKGINIRKGPNKVGYIGLLQKLLFVFVMLSKQLFY